MTAGPAHTRSQTQPHAHSQRNASHRNMNAGFYRRGFSASLASSPSPSGAGRDMIEQEREQEDEEGGERTGMDEEDGGGGAGSAYGGQGNGSASSQASLRVRSLISDSNFKLLKCVEFTQFCIHVYSISDATDSLFLH